MVLSSHGGLWCLGQRKLWVIAGLVSAKSQCFQLFQRFRSDFNDGRIEEKLKRRSPNGATKYSDPEGILDFSSICAVFCNSRGLDGAQERT